jgi:hypothetical protein
MNRQRRGVEDPDARRRMIYLDDRCTRQSASVAPFGNANLPLRLRRQQRNIYN